VKLLCGFPYPNEVIMYGSDFVDSLACRCKHRPSTTDGYRCASRLRQAFGYRRLHDENGRTLVGIIPMILPEFDNRIIPTDPYDEWGYVREDYLFRHGRSDIIWA
jgi:hypothetical protein